MLPWRAFPRGHRAGSMRPVRVRRWGVANSDRLRGCAFGPWSYQLSILRVATGDGSFQGGFAPGAGMAIDALPRRRPLRRTGWEPS
jgi:hypothetical protein